MVFSFACMGGIGGIGGYGVPKRTSHGIHVREAPSPSLEEGLPLLRACLVPYGIASGQDSEGAWRWCGSTKKKKINMLVFFLNQQLTFQLILWA